MIKPQNAAEELPTFLAPLFWDYRFGDLSWEIDRDLVIGRVLASSSWEAMQWLRQKLGDAGLRAWLEQREGAGLSRAQLRFWELLLDLPHHQVNAWIDAPNRQVWDGRKLP